MASSTDNTLSFNFANRNIYIFLLVVLPFVLIAISLPAYVQGQAASSFFAFFIFYLMNYKLTYKTNDFFSRYIFFLFVMGSLVGLIFSILGINSYYKWVQYSLLMLLSFLAYNAGIIVSGKKYLSSFIFLIVLADLLMAIPLILKGHVSRTSIGSSNLYPLLFTFLLNIHWFQNRRDRFKIFLSFFFLVIVYLFSGMRSGVSAMILSSLLILFYNFHINFTSKFFRLLFFVLLFFIIFIYVLPSSVRNFGMDRINSVMVRLDNTLFSDQGLRLDASEEGGRQLEAQLALNEFQERNEPINYIIGFGHGYTFYNFATQSSQAHIHMTYVAYFVRYGAVGLVFYFLLFVAVLYNICKLFFLKKNIINRLRFGLWISAFQVMLISIISASLINSINVFIIGAAFGLSKFNINPARGGS